MISMYEEYLNEQEKFKEEFMKGNTVSILKKGDIFIHCFVTKDKKVTYTKGIVKNDEGEMVIYIPTEDIKLKYGFGCTHKEIKETIYSSTRLIKHDEELLQQNANTLKFPCLKGNPGYDLMM